MIDYAARSLDKPVPTGESSVQPRGAAPIICEIPFEAAASMIAEFHYSHNLPNVVRKRQTRGASKRAARKTRTLVTWPGLIGLAASALSGRGGDGEKPLVWEVSRRPGAVYRTHTNRQSKGDLRPSAMPKRHAQNLGENCGESSPV
jgi:hypothetical protein